MCSDGSETGAEPVSGLNAFLEQSVDQPQNAVTGDFFLRSQFPQLPIAGQQCPGSEFCEGEGKAVRQ